MHLFWAKLCDIRRIYPEWNAFDAHVLQNFLYLIPIHKRLEEQRTKCNKQLQLMTFQIVKLFPIRSYAQN
jgi:hypothetical protein